jgi:NADH-quinone oxidoreductase subunit A
MPSAYLPLLFLAYLVLSLPVIALTIFQFFRHSSPNVLEKSRPDDSAIPAQATPSEPDLSRVFIIATLFVILSTVALFLYPWAIMFRTWLAAHLTASALLSMFFFLGILLVGYVWLYKKRAMDLA